MAHLWFRDEEDIWAAMPLTGAAVDISTYPPRAVAEGFRLGDDMQAMGAPASSDASSTSEQGSYSRPRMTRSTGSWTKSNLSA